MDLSQRGPRYSPFAQPGGGAGSTGGGAIGVIEPRHFHVYIHSKGVFWQPGGVQEYVVKAFLMDVRQTRKPHEEFRSPTWYHPEEARIILAKGREVKYAQELQAVIDRALEQLGMARLAAAR